MNTDLGSRAIATTNRNRGMVLVIMARLEREQEVFWPHGLAAFGIQTLIGLEPRINLPAHTWPYDMQRANAANDI